ncbi:MAG: tetratricopeptide repeat protein, partial [Candidatus Xenobia bacterium]
SAAVLECQQSIKIDPKNVQAYDLLSRILVQMQNWAYAIETFRTLEQLDPQNVTYPARLAQISQAYDMPLVEVGARENLARLQPTDIPNLLRLADVYGRLNLPDKVLDVYNRARQVAPNDPRVLTGLAEVLGDMNRPQQQVEVLEHLLAVQPDNRVVMVDLANMYSEASQPQKAYAIYQRLHTLEPRNKDYAELLADSSVDLGDEEVDQELYGHAVQYYEKALHLAPGTDSARRAQAALRRITAYTKPSVFSEVTTGIDADNAYNANSEGVKVPIKGTEMVVGAREDYHQANDITIGTDGQVSEQWVFALDRLSRHWALDGALGQSPTTGLGQLEAHYVSDTLEGVLGIRRDLNYETPLAIDTGLNYNEQLAELEWAITPRWEFDWELDGYQYSNHNNATELEYSLAYAVVHKPEKYDLSAKYIRNEFRNTFNENPLLRFGPEFLGTDFIGAVWQHSVNRNLQYRMEYYKSKDSEGNLDDNYEGRVDYAANRHLVMYVEWSQGLLNQGFVNVNAFENQNNHQTIIGGQYRF